MSLFGSAASAVVGTIGSLFGGAMQASSSKALAEKTH